MRKRNNLRERLNKGEFLRIVGAHNGLTAKLVEEAGFEGVWSSGLEISTAHAVPDANILNMSDFLDAATEMASTVSIPVIADCDTGYGNSNNVMHMVRKFESAGISAVCIEDKKFPKVNSFISGRQELAPIAEFVGKITAAKNAQIGKEFLVFARVEALIAGWSLDEALRRAKAYIDAGADGIFIHSKSNTPVQIMDFCRIWKKRSPILISPTSYYLSENQMRDLGVNVVIYANQGIRAAIKHIKDILQHIKNNSTAGLEERIAPMDEVFRIQGMHIMKDNEKKYLRSETGSIKVIIPAAGSAVDESLDLLLEDRPLGMLDINGKPILQRTIETLNLIGIQDINVVVGYKSEKVMLEGANIIKNDKFKDRGIIYSIIKGADSIADKNLILYSDIVVDQYLLQKIIRKEGDIILIVDSTYKKTHQRNKKLEAMKTKYPPADTCRVMDTERRNPVLRIGKGLSEEDADFEFIGIALLSKKGMERLLKEYRSAKLPKQASFTDLIQRMINKKIEVYAVEVNSGWMEIHNFQDYKRACSLFLT